MQCSQRLKFTQIEKLPTRLNRPLAMDRHRFLAPLCDFSLGNCKNADEENNRAVGNKRVKNISMSSDELWQEDLIGIAICSQLTCCETTLIPLLPRS